MAAIPVEQLEVIGYADTLDAGMLPSVVPPVFMVRGEPDRILVPPYTQNAGFLWGASEIDFSEIQELRDAGDVVLFENYRPAQIDFELWMDEGNSPHYETRTSARNNLTQLAEQSIQRAKAAFKMGNLAESERFCSSAMSADDKCLEASVIMAAILRRQGDVDGERLIARLVSPILQESSFAGLVDRYFLPNPVSPAAQMGPRVPPMQAVATYRAALVG
jgi:hypothetical protein